MPLDADRRHRLLELRPEGIPVSKAWLARQAPDMDRHAFSPRSPHSSHPRNGTLESCDNSKQSERSRKYFASVSVKQRDNTLSLTASAARPRDNGAISAFSDTVPEKQCPDQRAH